MKMNKWTVGLAAAGLVSLTSVAQAQDANSVQTKLGSTSLSGYVSTTYHWNIGDADDAITDYAVGGDKSDRFALDVVSLTLARPTTDGDWGAGYNVQMWLGPDASEILNDDDNGEIAIKNAFLTLNAPFGSGVDVTLGRFDTIMGMESMDYNLNPHYGHSWGYAIEPTIHEGLKASYQLTDNIGFTALFANTIDATSNGNAGEGDRKTYGFAFNTVAPDSFGYFSGSTFDFAYINGAEGDPNNDNPVQNYYMAFSVPTSVDKLSAGLALDYRKNGGGEGQTDSVVGLYLEYAATEKLTLNVRIEDVDAGPANAGYMDDNHDSNPSDLWDMTVTANYKLWDGVVTRLEYRYTNADSPRGDVNQSADSTLDEHSHSLFANVIYEF